MQYSTETARTGITVLFLILDKQQSPCIKYDASFFIGVFFHVNEILQSQFAECHCYQRVLDFVRYFLCAY